MIKPTQSGLQKLKKLYTFKEITCLFAAEDRYLDIQDYKSNLLVTGMRNALEIYNLELQRIGRIHLELDEDFESVYAVYHPPKKYFIVTLRNRHNFSDVRTGFFDENGKILGEGFGIPLKFPCFKVSTDGSIYALDIISGLLYVFDADLNLIHSIGKEGDVKFFRPMDVGISASSLYIPDEHDYNLRILDTGKLSEVNNVIKFDHLLAPKTVALDDSRQIWVVASNSSWSSTLFKFDPDCNLVFRKKIPQSITRLLISRSNLFCIADNKRIVKYLV